MTVEYKGGSQFGLPEGTKYAVHCRGYCKKLKPICDENYRAQRDRDWEEEVKTKI